MRCHSRPKVLIESHGWKPHESPQAPGKQFDKKINLNHFVCNCHQFLLCRYHSIPVSKITDLCLDTSPRSRPQIFKGLIQLLPNEELPGPDFPPADLFTKHGSTSIPNSSTHGDVLNTFFERTLSQRFRQKIDLPSCTKGFTCSQQHLPQSCSSA